MTSRSRGRSPARTLFGWVTAALVAVTCFLAVFTVVVPFLLGAQPYTVLTGSMRPGLEPGHLVGVRPIDIDDVEAGNIVTFQLRSGQPEVATHRVVGVTEDGHGERLLITRGDANNVADAEPVQAAQLRGVVVYAVPWLGRINVWATPAVKSVVVTTIGALAVGYGALVLIRDGVRRRSAPRAAAACVIAALAWSVVGAPIPARAATEPPPSEELELSGDGRTWTSGESLVLFADDTFVPGDTASRTLWIRNASADPAVTSVRATWTPVDPAVPADAALADALVATADGVSLGDDEPWAGPTLQPGAIAQIPLTAALPWEAGMATRNGAASLTVQVTLTQMTPTPSDTPSATAAPLPPAQQPGASPAFADLATTGGTAAVWVVALGAIALVSGIGGRMLATRRR